MMPTSSPLPPSRSNFGQALPQNFALAVRHPVQIVAAVLDLRQPEGDPLQGCELRAGQTATQELVFFNDLKPGMHLIKVDSADLSKPIANAKFKFTAVDG